MIKNIFLICTLLLVPEFAFSHMGDHMQPGMQQRRIFTDANKMVIEGEIQEIIEAEHPKGKMFGILLEVKADDKIYKVLTGPNWFMEEMDLDLSNGDQVRIEGFLVEAKEKSALVALSIEKDGQVFELRDEEGVPKWRGMGREKAQKKTL